MGGLPTSPHFTAHEVAPGAHALVAGRGGTAVSNSAVIDLGDRTLVFDTFETLQAADDLLAVTLALTGRRAAVVVNSHWHDDHTTGNQVFEGAEIVSTATTVELIAANTYADRASLAREIEEYLEFARKSLAEAETEEERARAEGWLRVGGDLRAGLPRFRLTLPNKLIEDRLTVAGEGRRVEILTYGGGHTASDVFAHLPAEGIVLAGDLLFAGLHPRADDGDPASWSGILGRMLGLGAPCWVPGHGRLAGAGDAAVLAAYLQVMASTVAEVVAEGLDADAVARLPVPPGSEGWEGRVRFTSSVRALAARLRDEGSGA